MSPNASTIGWLTTAIVAILPAGEAKAQDVSNWREGRAPRIELPPDPRAIAVIPAGAGRARVIGALGAVEDDRARTVRVVNLRTADEILVPVRPGGAFIAGLFAPPGSPLQINSCMPRLDELPPHLQTAVSPDGTIRLTELAPGRAEELAHAISSHWSSSPATIIHVANEHQSPGAWPGFVKKVGPKAWCFGQATLAPSRAQPGEEVQFTVELSFVSAREQSGLDVPERLPAVHPTLHLLFDEEGRQCAGMRLSVSHLLTPTGLPIEAHNEMVVEPAPHGPRHWLPADSGLPVPCRIEESQPWRSEYGVVRTRQALRIEVPDEFPSGWYGVGAHIVGLGQEGYEVVEFDGGPWYLGCLQVGRPAEPRLACLLLGSSGTGGTRGTVAREDRGHYAINPRNVLHPDALVVPRDDAYTSRPIRYPLDPYLPLVARAERPVPVLRSPRIPFDFSESRLTVTVTAPDGTTRKLGPGPLVAGQHDLSVLRPDYVVRGRVVPPVAPTYGNPSLGDIYHLTGRGTFDHAFEHYGRHVIELDGEIRDLGGNPYRIAGTYDVFVARSLDVDVFPEPGTPLSPGVGLTPQVRVQPAVPAEVEIRWRHYPHSDARRMVQRTIQGRANRFGVFVPDASEPPVSFVEPGEYVSDVTVRHWDDAGTLWMASRRGASVVVTPDSKIVVHGERGNRSPTARWRARWFVAGDNRFVAPPENVPRTFGINLGHTCYPYESGDVAWLGHRGNFSLFPNVTFEDPEGTVARLIERRWPGVRRGEGREGLYPYELLPEDRRAIGELPYVSMTFNGLPPGMAPKDVDQWGYFYTTSWRPGLGVRAQVSEDTVPTGYWFFDDPYGWQFGTGPQGDLAGDVKMNYGGGVFRDLFTGTTHYGAYASMLVLVGGDDRRGARVLPPFDGLVPGSPRSGPLLEIGGKRYDVFLTFGAVGPGAVLQQGDRLRVAGVVWPPVSGHVEGRIVSPSGRTFPLEAPSDAVGLFDAGGPVADEPGLWQVTIEGVCSGKTSAGTITELVPRDRWPRGGGIGLEANTFRVPVVRQDAEPIRFDVPSGARASPPSPLALRGRLPTHATADTVDVVVSLPGQVVDRRSLHVRDGTFQYVYDPEQLRRAFPNIDTRIEVPFLNIEHTPAWFDTVTFSFWAGDGDGTTAGTVLLQGEQLIAQAATGRPLPETPAASRGPDWLRPRPSATAGLPSSVVRSGATAGSPSSSTSHGQPAPHSSLLGLLPGGSGLIAAHPWSGEVVRLDAEPAGLRVTATVPAGGEPRAVALSPDGRGVYVALSEASRILVLDVHAFTPVTLFDVPAEPRALVCSPDGSAVFVADFRGDRVLRVNAVSGRVEAASEPINRPASLALSPQRGEVYTASFRTGEIVVLDDRCRVLQRLPAPRGLGQCRHLTVGPDGLVYAPQTRADTRLGGQMFDRSVFPVVAVADSEAGRVSVEYSPDLLVVPPHRPTEVAVDRDTLYLASAGSDDVLAIDRSTGFARWHAPHVDREPAGIVLDSATGRLHVLTITGQSIVTLESRTGRVVGRVRFTDDPTPPDVARGRYLFGTAADARLTKDQWVSCAVCHPDGAEDGRQWDFGDGPLDTRSLRGCLATSPLHFDAHLDEIQDTYQFTRMVMGGRWFLPRHEMHEWLGEPNAGLDRDLDALAAYIGSLRLRTPHGAPADLVPTIQRGREIFFSEKTGCSHCHPPPSYTDSGKRNERGWFVLHNVGTRTSSGDAKPRRLDTPSLLDLARSEPYLHDGRAATLEEVFTRFNPDDKHGKTSHLSPADVRALVEFVRRLSQER
ncbi:MAG: hypothetical protein JXB62_18985 [Pirellulales bacterium]|nr:hypothetical protein [Pirellulales bacterium]